MTFGLQVNKADGEDIFSSEGLYFHLHDIQKPSLAEYASFVENTGGVITPSGPYDPVYTSSFSALRSEVTRPIFVAEASGYPISMSAPYIALGYSAVQISTTSAGRGNIRGYVFSGDPPQSGGGYGLSLSTSSEASFNTEKWPLKVLGRYILTRNSSGTLVSFTYDGSSLVGKRVGVICSTPAFTISKFNTGSVSGAVIQQWMVSISPLAASTDEGTVIVTKGTITGMTPPSTQGIYSALNRRGAFTIVDLTGFPTSAEELNG